MNHESERDQSCLRNEENSGFNMIMNSYRRIMMSFCDMCYKQVRIKRLVTHIIHHMKGANPREHYPHH